LLDFVFKQIFLRKLSKITFVEQIELKLIKFFSTIFIQGCCFKAANFEKGQNPIISHFTIYCKEAPFVERAFIVAFYHLEL
jgi:hypothetical protein